MNEQEKIQAHRLDFERFYMQRPDSDSKLRFPLEDVEENTHRKNKSGRPITCYMSRRFSTHILSMLELRGDEDLLVLGCGMGTDEKNLKALFPKVRTLSTDISLEMIRRAVLNKTPSIFSVAAAEALPFPDNCFDRVVSREVIEHVDGQETMVREIARVLKPGGLAVVTTENERSLAPPNDRFKAVRKAIHAITGNPFVEPFFGYKDEAPAPAELRAMAEKAGLEMGRIVYDGALYHTLPRVSKRLAWINPVAVAHTASALENGFLASWFCDQYKMVLRKPMSAAPTQEPAYALPGGGALLVRDGDEMVCPKTGARFAVENEIPDFVGLPLEQKDGSEGGDPLTRPDKAVRPAGRVAAMGRALDRFLVSLYPDVLCLLGWGVSHLFPSNAVVMSRQLGKSGDLARYIALGLERNI